jgi:hypothetical protein
VRRWAMVGVEGALRVDKLGGEYASYEMDNASWLKTQTKTFSKGARRIATKYVCVVYVVFRASGSSLGVIGLRTELAQQASYRRVRPLDTVIVRLTVSLVVFAPAC